MATGLPIGGMATRPQITNTADAPVVQLNGVREDGAYATPAEQGDRLVAALGKMLDGDRLETHNLNAITGVQSTASVGSLKLRFINSSITNAAHLPSPFLFTGDDVDCFGSGAIISGGGDFLDPESDPGGPWNYLMRVIQFTGNNSRIEGLKVVEAVDIDDQASACIYVNTQGSSTIVKNCWAENGGYNNIQIRGGGRCAIVNCDMVFSRTNRYGEYRHFAFDVGPFRQAHVLNSRMYTPHDVKVRPGFNVNPSGEDGRRYSCADFLMDGCELYAPGCYDSNMPNPTGAVTLGKATRTDKATFRNCCLSHNIYGNPLVSFNMDGGSNPDSRLIIENSNFDAGIWLLSNADDPLGVGHIYAINSDFGRASQGFKNDLGEDIAIPALAYMVRAAGRLTGTGMFRNCRFSNVRNAVLEIESTDVGYNSQQWTFRDGCRVEANSVDVPNRNVYCSTVVRDVRHINWSVPTNRPPIDTNGTFTLSNDAAKRLMCSMRSDTEREWDTSLLDPYNHPNGAPAPGSGERFWNVNGLDGHKLIDVRGGGDFKYHTGGWHADTVPQQPGD